MKKQKIKKVLKRVLIGALLLIIIGGVMEHLWVSRQIKLHTGSYTEVINPEGFATNYHHIGIQNINILSVSDSSYFTPRNVVLKDGLIVAIHPIDSIDTNVKYIDGSNKFLIPGLVDTHVHLSDSKNDLYLYLANGVTSVCEMFGNKQHLEWKKEAEQGSVSPDIYVASSKVTNQKGLYHALAKYYGGPINYTSVKAAKKGVKKLKKDGYDAIKLSSRLNPEIYAAILEEANSQSIPVIGHLAEEVGLNNLYTSGQSQLAHIEEITKNTMHEFGGLGYNNTKEYIDYLTKHAGGIAQKIKENNITVSSTIWLMESLPGQKFDLDNFIRTVKLSYANPGMVEGSEMNKGWLPGNNHYENLDIKKDAERRKNSKLFWDTYVEAIHIMTKALIDNDVTILAGTDTNVACMVPGFSLHDEMNSLTSLGMSNAQALLSATQTPADFMSTNTGKIAVGYESDLVILSKNPLENIQHTQAIEYVFFNGFMIDKTQIEYMLQAVKEANDRSRKKDISAYLHK